MRLEAGKTGALTWVSQWILLSDLGITVCQTGRAATPPFPGPTRAYAVLFNKTPRHGLTATTRPPFVAGLRTYTAKTAVRARGHERAPSTSFPAR
jgi:hypothetical protein